MKLKAGPLRRKSAFVFKIKIKERLNNNKQIKEVNKRYLIK